MRELLREFLPPIAARAYRTVTGRAFGFRGDYADWASARAASVGYDAGEVLARTRDAALKVMKGEAAMDRDGVAFEAMDFPFAVMAGLLRAAWRPGALTVLDIGGSLGNVYRQFRAFAPPITTLRWHVVEQPAVVEAGRGQFENAELRFFTDIASATAAAPPDVVLLSSTLQYLEAPYALIEMLGAIGARSMVIDRTPCAESARDVLAVQTVPSEIYRGSYPCWIFSRAKLEAAFAPRFRAVASFCDVARVLRSDQGPFELRGYLLDART